MSELPDMRSHAADAVPATSATTSSAMPQRRLLRVPPRTLTGWTGVVAGPCGGALGAQPIGGCGAGAAPTDGGVGLDGGRSAGDAFASGAASDAGVDGPVWTGWVGVSSAGTPAGWPPLGWPLLGWPFVGRAPVGSCGWSVIAFACPFA